MNANARRLAVGGLVALLLAGAAAASSTPAAAQYDHRYRETYAGPAGPVFVGGVTARVSAGAVWPPLFAAPYAYAPGLGCYMTQVPAYDQWGQFAGYGPIQICE